jgi:hypothetical protein
MYRIVGGITIATGLIAATFGFYGVLTFPVVFVVGLVLGIPCFLVLQKFGYLSWWYAALAGVLCAVPLVLIYLGMNPGHTRHVGLYNSVYAVFMGFVGGVVVWMVAIFRNREYPEHWSFPKSILVVLPIILVFFAYRAKLEPEYLYGCIVGYEAAENPTPWEHAYAKFELSNGIVTLMPLTVGYSNLEIVGNCAWYSRKRNASLAGFNYSLHSTNSNGKCSPPCPNQTDA